MNAKQRRKVRRVGVMPPGFRWTKSQGGWPGKHALNRECRVLVKFKLELGL